MYKTKALLIVAIVLSITSVSRAVNILFVDVHGPNDPGTGSANDPFREIQDAINAAQNGDAVEIRPGTYTGEGNYNLDPNGKSITIRSTNPENTGVVANTVLDPNGKGRGFYLHSGEDANCVISGLTIRNASAATGYNGAGIYCDNSSPSIINCTITDNFAEGYGCGVSCTNSNFQIRNCTISNNRGRYGGGVGCFDFSSITITNCTIVRNTAIFSGGGVFCDMDGHVVINSSIIWANKLDYPEEEYGPQVCLFGESSASISYTSIEGGLEGVASIESTLYWLSGNIEADPCFASFDPNGDPNIWDFHLKSAYGRWDTDFDGIDFNKDRVVNLFDFAEFADVWLQSGNLPEDLNQDGTIDFGDMQILAEHFLTTGWVFDTVTSPCIDAGDPNSDWSSEPWPNGKRINMGAYGGTFQASKNGNPADFDINGIVDFVDFAEFSDDWFKQETSCIEDLTSDKTVNFSDLRIFAENWLWQR